MPRALSELSKLALKPLYYIYERKLEREIDRSKLPKHVAIIMDGNRRFARKLGFNPWDGHEFGAEKLEDVLEWCYDLGIKIVTVYAFSMENFSRPKEEVERLMDLFERKFLELSESEKIHKRRVRVRAIGRRELLPERVRKAIEIAEERTKDYEDRFLNVAIAYGGRAEIVDAVRKLLNDVLDGRLDPERVDEGEISRRLYTAGLPDPDLIIRTSGEERISGFLLWQCAYSELYFCDVYWPEFRRIDLLRAIRSYQHRERRFGR